MNRLFSILSVFALLICGNAQAYDTTFQPSTPQTTLAADSDSVDVSGANIVFVDTSTGNVTIGGLSGGTVGQTVRIIKTDTSNDMIIENQEAAGTEQFKLYESLDETFEAIGGLIVTYDGTYWVGHSSTGETSTLNLDDAYNYFGASPALVTIDNAEGQGDLNIAPTGAYSLVTDISGATGTSDGFSVVDGSDQFDLIHKGSNLMDLDADLQNANINASVNMDLAAGGVLTIVTPTIADFTNSTHDHSNTPGGGTIAHGSLTAGNDKVFYSGNSGAMNELALGAANTFLLSNGTTSAPSFGYVPAASVSMDVLGTPTYDDVDDWWKNTQSAGIVEGGTISDGGSGTVDVTAVKGILKTTNSAIGANVWFDLTGLTGQALTDNSTNYIAVDYNSGTPQWVVGTSNTSNGHTIFNVGKVYREGANVDIISSGLNIYDFTKRVQQHHVEEADLHFVSGAIVGETGTRNISITAGVMYAGVNRILTDAIDTSVADDFEYYYNNGTWQESSATQINNTQYNNFGVGLATLSNNQYGVHWVYKGTNGTSYVIYGQSSYTLVAAQAAQPPSSLPDHVSEFGALRAKIIILKNAAVFTEIESVTDTMFAASTPSNHNELANIQGGSAGLYYHSNQAINTTASPSWVNATLSGDLIAANAYTRGIAWESGTSAADLDWGSVAYGNGLFVAVAYSGTGNRVMTSPDGINWTSRTSASDNNWRSITYGNGLFVAVASSGGTGNRVMTSPDGITWTSRTNAVDLEWRSVTYSNGLFVAVASSGTGNRVMTSPDGITWTSRTSAADLGWRSVTYGKGLFVAVADTGTGNRVMTSPDGITWTSRTIATDRDWRSVTYGNGLFVAVASTGTGNRVMTSPDGITWTSRTSAADLGWRSVTYGDGLFVAVADDGTVNSVMTSPDGITWTTRTAASSNDWFSVSYGNGIFVAISYTGTGDRAMTSGFQNDTIQDDSFYHAPFTFTDSVSIGDVTNINNGGASTNSVASSLSMGHNTADDSSWLQSEGAAAGRELKLNPEGGDISLGGDLLTDYYLDSDTNSFIGSGVAGAGNLSHVSGDQGWYNSLFGYQTGYSLTSGYGNGFVSNKAGYSNTSGYLNMFAGYLTGYSNTTGYLNAFYGYQAGYANTDGDSNVYIGSQAGRYENGGGANTSSTDCILIGNDTRVASSGETNETAIGQGTIGIGSNTVTLGNSSVTQTRLGGLISTVNGGASTNSVASSLSMGHNTADDSSWLQSEGAAAGSVLELNPQGGNVTIGSTGPVTVSSNVIKAASTGGSGFLARTAVSSEGNPTFSSVDDTNTGMFFPAADTLAFTTGGTERVRVGSSGNVGIGISPSYKFSVGSSDGSDQIGLYHDNTDAYMTWNDGNLNLITDEGTNTDTYVNITGKGTGRGFVRFYDEDASEYLEIFANSGTGQIRTAGSSPSYLSIQSGAHAGVNLFESAASGETQELKIYGYRTSDSLRSLEIGVGVDAADTASFDGVSNYYFDGNMSASGLDVSGVSTVSDGSDSSNYEFDTLSFGYDTSTDKSWIQSGGAAAESELQLNPEGGDVSIGGTGSTIDFPGLSVTGSTVTHTGYVTINIGGVAYNFMLGEII